MAVDDPKDSVGIPSVAIDWYRSVPWWSFCSKSVTIAWRISHLLLGTLAVYLISFGWYLAGKLFGTSPNFEWKSQSSYSMFDIWRGLAGSLSQLHSESGLSGLATILFGGLWTAAICGFIGGMLARRSVYELGTQSASDWASTFHLVKRRIPSLMWTLCMPWCAALLMIVPAILVGLLHRLGSAGGFLANVGMVPMILLMIGAGWLALLGALGFPLAVVAVVSEKHADAFDGFSRSAAYLYQKPATFGMGVALASIILFLSSNAVDFAMSLGREMVFATASFSAGESVTAKGGFGMALADGLTRTMTLGFAFSFFWAASAALYLTLRNEVDHADFDDIDLDEKLPPKGVPDIGKPPATHENPALSGIHEQAE